MSVSNHIQTPTTAAEYIGAMLLMLPVLALVFLCFQHDGVTSFTVCAGIAGLVANCIFCLNLVNLVRLLQRKQPVSL